MNSNDKVFIAKCTTYSSELVQKSVERCIDAFGGMDTILNATGKRVLVKPNLIKAARVEEAATTNPAVVRAVCLMLKKSGAEITIYDSPAVGHTRAHLELLYRQTGMTAIAEEVGATLCTEPVSHSVDYNGRKLTISGAVLSSDLIINIPKMKTHSFVGMTGAVKNLFGAVPGLAKSQSHAMNVDVNSFACLIVDLCECIKSRVPVFSLMDGIVGMEGKGPTAGDPKYAGALLSSWNPYALDVAALDIMGIRQESAPITARGIKLGLTKRDTSLLELKGDDISAFRTKFKPPRKTNVITMALNSIAPKFIKRRLERKTKNAPVVDKHKCIGCGRCVEICPVQTAYLDDNRKFALDPDRCIRCYCCHEVCPTRALDI